MNENLVHLELANKVSLTALREHLRKHQREQAFILKRRRSHVLKGLIICEVIFQKLSLDMALSLTIFNIPPIGITLTILLSAE